MSTNVTQSAALAYWVERLDGAPVLELVTDRVRPAVRRGVGDRVELAVDPATTARLQELSRTHDVPPLVFLVATLQLVLGRYAGIRDVSVGTPGPDGTMVVLRTRWSAATTFAELLELVDETTRQAYAHQDVPMERIVEALASPRDQSRTPLFQVALAMTASASPAGSAPYDLSVVWQEEADPSGELRGLVDYDVDLFDRASVQRMMAHYVTLLESALAQPQAQVADLAHTTADERTLLAEWGTVGVTARAATLLEAVRARARATPDAIALEFVDGTLTYAELRERSERMAEALVDRGITPESVVALAMDRSATLIVAMLAVATAGAAYLPLDPGHPPERLAFMVRDSRAGLVLADREPQFGIDVPFVPVGDIDLESAAHRTGPRVFPVTHPDQRACVLYTSGSTGRPKGVEITHRGIVRLVCDAGYLGFTPSDVVAQAANTSFDAATWEIWGALCNGGRLVGVDKDEVLSPALLETRVRALGVTVLLLTTAVFHQCADSAPGMFAGLRVLLFGGEQADARRVAAVHRAAPEVRMVNAYGPTEATTIATSCDIEQDPPDAARIPIGQPIDGTTVHVLDDRGREVGIGIPGELYIGGAGLARGYAGRADLTAERFVPSAFTRGARLYRSGDVVRWREDGRLEFLGRADDQVKIRGVRIEPEEIASVLTTCPGVRGAFVDVRGDGDARRLVAYVVADDAPVSTRSMRDHLVARLPDAMVPAWYVPLAELPVTPNGKVDRRALPAPAAQDVVQAETWVAPCGATEELIAQVWADLFGLPAVSAHDNFFDLGGHSLLATRMVTRVADRLGVELSVRAAYEAPTVARLAALAGSDGHRDARPPVVPAGAGPHPLSFAQQSLWFLDQLAPGLPLYNVQLVLTIDGRLDVPALDAATHALVGRHAALRTRFAVGPDGEPRQVIDVDAAGDLPVTDLRHLSLEAGDTHVADLARGEAEQPFDLSTGPLVRFRLLQLDEERFVLLATLHHAVFDGWSVGVFLRDLGAFYAAATGQDTAPLPPLAVQYADYAHWQRKLLAGDLRDEQLAYWKDQVAGAPAALELPTDRPRPAVPRYAGDMFPVRLPAALTRRLDEVGREHGVTRFMILLAAFQLMLGRYADERDVSVGTPVLGRTRPELEDLVGFFINTLVVRTRWSDTMTFTQLLARVRESTLGAYEHQDVPFEQVVEAVAPTRTPGRSPLFQVMLSMQNVPVTTDALPGLAVAVRESTGRVAKFDLTVAWEEVPATTGEMVGRVEYDVDLFDRETVERMMGHYLTLLETVVDAPASPLSELAVVGGSEVTEGFEAPLPSPAGTLHELVDAAAARWPQRTALQQGDRSLRYADLAARSDDVSRHLHEQGVRPGDTVAVWLERTPAWPIALLGILKAGAAYVPMDVATPPERAGYLLADSEASLVVGSRDCSVAPPPGLPFVAVEDAAPGVAAPPSGHPSAPAYVLYTSGTTGRPKGVCVSHANLVQTLTAVADRYDLCVDDRVLQFAALGFDVAAEELFATLIRGATVVLAPPGPVLGIDELTSLARRERLSVLNLPASYWHEWVSVLDRYPPSSCPALRLVVVGSERVDGSSLADWQAAAPEHPRLLNAYGPTETTITATVHEPAAHPERAPAGTVPIGAALPGVRAYVLDGAKRPVPQGVPGELYVAGPGVASGYLHDPARTAKVFLPDPWGGPGERMYATGDRARRLPDGEFEFLGRGDDQVKLRGFRIELGDVEAALAAHPDVRGAAVLLREDTPGQPMLVGYVTLAAEVSTSQLHRHLADRLPGYMVPAAVVTLDELPQSERHKIDRSALPPPPRPAAAGGDPPADGLEGTVAEIWRDVLAVERVDANDNFFDAGGNSLLVVRVQSRLAEELGRPVPVVDLFRFPTVRSLARHLSVGAADRRDAASRETGRRRAEARKSMQDARTPRRRSG
ncbi:MAG TPA: amino acid adenylation domain-containing protein [Micromonosporaceae bacterium]|nr:amino acid adenylation domain-containing protein [Micromonosporaceae bacterium]